MKLLLVEDDRDAAAMLQLLLRHGGHDVVLASSGPEALRHASDHRPDVVVSDIRLPGMSGRELARALREDPEQHGVILIALSGFDRQVDRERSLAAGFDEHLVKPVSLSGLQHAIESALSRKRTLDPERTGARVPERAPGW
ncbi:MAG: response regulator [Sandaracinaceae bacterium]|nr:response regulator [Sandaracinaceae bacterium]